MPPIDEPTGDSGETVATPAPRSGGEDVDAVKKAKANQASILKEKREIESKYKELQTRLEEIESASEQKNGEFSKIQERYERKLAAAQKELDGYRAAEAKRQYDERHNALINAVSAKSGVQNPKLLVGLILSAARENPELNLAPEEVDDSIVDSYLHAIKSVAPEVFAPPPPRPSPVPGSFPGKPPQEQANSDDIMELIAARARAKGPPRA